MTKTLRTLVAIAIAAFVLPMPATAFHEDQLPVIYSAGSAGSASYGVKYEHAGGSFAIDLLGSGPGTAQSASAGAFFFDSNKNVLFGFAFTGHSSPDRLILSPAGETGSAAALPDWLDVNVETADSSADGACTFFCVGLSSPGAPAGTYYYLLWLSGVSANSFEIRADNAGVATVNAGAAYMVGDAEIDGGDLNVQAQQTPGGVATVGAKAMSNAAETVNVQDKLWGFWGASDFKLACQFTVGACVWASAVTYECYNLGVSCDTTAISWNGPNGGESGSMLYDFLGDAAGSYTISVDSKVEAYGPNVYDPATGTWLFLGENYSYFTAADNDLP